MNRWGEPVRDGEGAWFLAVIAVLCGWVSVVLVVDGEALGGALGAGVAGMAFAQFMERFVRWREGRSARMGVNGEPVAERLEREAEWTGWWVTPDGVSLVRWDPVISRFLLDARVWPDAEVLGAYLRFCEQHEGWTALGDEATERVRERLGLS